MMKASFSDVRIVPGTNVDYHILNEPQSVVRICVESPKESPTTEIPININEPIDVNLPRDTSNIFYDYEEPKQSPTKSISQITHQEVQDLDKIEYDTSGMKCTKSDEDLRRIS